MQREAFRKRRVRAAVKIIPRHRMPNVRHVHTNLMGSAGFQLQRNQRPIRLLKASDYLSSRHAGLAALANAAAHAIALHSVDGRIDGEAVLFYSPFAERSIPPLEIRRVQNIHQALVHQRGFCYGH